MDHFDIILVDFPDGPKHGDTPAEAVAQAFKIDRRAAQRMVAKLPAVVRRGATRLEAKKYYNALTFVGGRVRFEPSQGKLQEPKPPVAAATVAGEPLGAATREIPGSGLTPFSTKAVADVGKTAEHNPPDVAPLRREVVARITPQRVAPDQRSIPQGEPRPAPGPSAQRSEERPQTNPHELPFSPPSKSQRAFKTPELELASTEVATIDLPTPAPVDSSDPFADPFAPAPDLLDLSASSAADLFGAPLASSEDDTTELPDPIVPADDGELAFDLDLSLPDLSFPEADGGAPTGAEGSAADQEPLDLPTLTPSIEAAARAMHAFEATAPTQAPRAAEHDFALQPRPDRRTVAPDKGMRPAPPMSPSVAISPRSRPQGPASAQAHRPVERAPALYEEVKGFYAGIPSAFAMPFTGEGLKWMAAIAATTVLLGFVMVLSVMMPLMGLVMTFAVGSTVLALSAKFFEASAWATANGSDSPNTFPDLTDVIGELVVPGYVLAIFGAILFIVPQMVVSNASPLLSVVLLLVPFVYWPMGLTLCTRDGSFLPIFNVVGVLIAIARVPIKYAVVIGIGAVAMILPAVVGGIMIASGVRGAALLGLLLTTLPGAYAHGVLGAMMGRLVYEHPDAFSV